MGKKNKKQKYSSVIASYIQTSIADPFPEPPPTETPRGKGWTRNKPDPELVGIRDQARPQEGPRPRSSDRFREVGGAREGRLVLSITEDPQGRHSYSIEREIHDGRKFRHLHPRDIDDLIKLAEYAKRWLTDNGP